ncbi:MAG: ATP-binding cassette domain-containing protein [Clostridiales bacterium]|nr:ATP-binding cassette domain-containing protein [Clostridiales bacterium]
MKLLIDHASFHYKNQKDLFTDVSFTIQSGDMVSILGPNGSGKTTLLRAILGILPWACGRSILDDENISDLSAAKLWSKISYVPQAHGTAGSYTVLDSVLFGMTTKIGVFSVPSKEQIEYACSILEDLHLLHLRDRRCSELSGGELQMTLIARALASDPGLLVLDEPESNLDFKNQIIVLDTLSRLCQKGVGVLFNTHYPEHALRRSNLSLLLDHGRVLYGPTAEIITEENIASAFGVKAIIGEVETNTSQIKNVIPISLIAKSTGSEGSSSESSEKNEQEHTALSANSGMLASISIILSNFEESEKVNGILHDFNDILFGRMGMPYRKRNLYLININLDGPVRRIEELYHRLSLLPDVSVKVTYEKDTTEWEEQK